MGASGELIDRTPYALQVKEIVEGGIDLSHRDFQLIYVGSRQLYDVILVYQSPRCRVRFAYSRGRYALPEGDVGQSSEESLAVEYGRLHAPLTADHIVVDGERLTAWHGGSEIVNFLQYRAGRVSLDDIVRGHGRMLIWEELAQEADPSGELPRMARWTATIEAAWRRFGGDMFELLDISNEEGWNAYRMYRRDLWGAIQNREREIEGERAQAGIDLLSLTYDRDVA